MVIYIVTFPSWEPLLLNLLRFWAKRNHGSQDLLRKIFLLSQSRQRRLSEIQLDSFLYVSIHAHLSLNILFIFVISYKMKDHLTSPIFSPLILNVCSFLRTNLIRKQCSSIFSSELSIIYRKRWVILLGFQFIDWCVILRWRSFEETKFFLSVSFFQPVSVE